MKLTSPFLIANWKMYYSYDQAREWFQTYQQELAELAQKTSLIFCPSYEILPLALDFFAQTTIKFGAQNCSEYSSGAYTGQIMAQSLKELHVAYCLIGHSEVRTALHENNEQLLRKMEQLIINNIIPIFCLGESKTDYEQKKTKEIIEHQLQPLIQLLKNNSQNSLTCLVAYEPVWAIGTGIVAHNNHIIEAATLIKQQLQPYATMHTLPIVYGGTVTSDTIIELKKIELLEGFLIGKATTHFQELKKIISLL